MIYSQLHSLKNNGLSWIMCILTVLLTNAAYTPFMKTALMIVACHPYYQCEFGECWSLEEQKFSLAVFLAFVAIVFIGIGFPLSLFLILRRRRTVVSDTFLSTANDSRLINSPKHQNLNAKEGTGSHVSKAAREAARSTVGSRFVQTDTTALAGRYRTLNINWLNFPPLLIVLKTALLIPAIFLEPRSFEQRAGCAAVEVVIAVLVFSASIYLSPIMLLVLRAASVHQLVILGLQNMDLVTQNTGRGTFAGVMVAVTAVYITFSCGIFVSTVAWPLLEAALSKRRLKNILRKHGLEYSGAVHQFLDPTVGYVERNRAGISVPIEQDEDMPLSFQITARRFSTESPRSRQPQPITDDLFVSDGFLPVIADNYASFEAVQPPSVSHDNLGISKRGSFYRAAGGCPDAPSSPQTFDEPAGFVSSFSPSPGASDPVRQFVTPRRPGAGTAFYTAVPMSSSSPAAVDISPTSITANQALRVFFGSNLNQSDVLPPSDSELYSATTGDPQSMHQNGELNSSILY